MESRMDVMKALADKYMETTHGFFVPCPGDCGWKHGAIIGLSKKEIPEVERMLEYYLAASRNKGAWWEKGKNGTYSVEFNTQSKVFPPPKKPWEWCGRTILFKDWKDREDGERKLKSTYKIGQAISFLTPKGCVYEGIVASLGKRAKVIIPGKEQWWYVPYTDLREV